MAALLFCLFNVLCIWLLISRFSFFSAVTIFTASFYLYYGVFYVCYFLGAPGIQYTPAQAITELVFLDLFIAGAAIGVLIHKRGLLLPAPVFAPPSFKSILFTSYLLIVAGLALYGAFIYAAYGSFSNMLHLGRFALYQRKVGLGSLFIGLDICFAGVLLRLGYYILYRRRVAQPFPVIAGVVACILLALNFINGDRANIMFFMLPLSLIVLFRRPRLSYHLLYILPVVLVCMQIVAAQRKAQHTKLILFSEYLAPARVDNIVYSHLSAGSIRYGRTYTDVVLNLSPAWLSPHRPDLPAVWYVSTYFPDIYHSGGGYGFSIIAESLINFYYFGPLLYGFLLVALLFYMERRLQGASFYYFVCYCILQFYVFIIPRSGFACLVKPALIAVILPLFCVHLLASALFGTDRKNKKE